MRKLLCILTALILSTALLGAANDLNLSQVKPGGIGNDGKQIPMENAITNGSLPSFHEAIDLGLTDSPQFTGLTLSGLTNTRVLFSGASGALSGDAGFLFNSTTDILTAAGFTSTVATGTAPFVVASTTQVANLNAATAGSATTATTATNATNTTITDDTTTNATMYPTWVTAATGNLPQKVSSTKMTFNPSTGALGVSGSITPSTTGGIVGTTTNNNATAGSVGEYVEAQLLQASALSLTTATPVDVTSISLTAGDWDVTGTFYFNPANTTSVTLFVGLISSVSANIGDNNVIGGRVQDVVTKVSAGNGNSSYVAPPRRFSLSATTTIYLCAQSNFTISTATVFGNIRARRVR